MRHTSMLLSLCLLTPTLAGCPPVRGDDDDSSVGDDDDATAQDLTLTEGYWTSTSVTVVSSSCELPNAPQQLSFDLELQGGGAFATDWGVDSLVECTGAAGFFDCPSTQFVANNEPDTTIAGSIGFSGEILSDTSLDGTVEWVITCTGDCDGSGLPPDTTCTFTMDGSFVFTGGPIDPEPDPEPPTAG